MKIWKSERILKMKKKIKRYTNYSDYYLSRPDDSINNSEKNIYLLGMPTYGNLGDQAIAYAEHKFFDEFFSDYNIIEINDKQFYKKASSLKAGNKENDKLVLIGGGNFGNLYYTAQEQRLFAMKFLNKFFCVQFPQSIYFTNNKEGQHSLNEFKKNIKKSEMKFFIRERKSYEYFKNNIKNNSVYLTPDIVTFLNLNFDQVERKGIICLLRDDIEKNIDDKYLTELLDKLNKYNDLTITDTHIGDDNVILEDQREKILIDFWSKISSKELIITDRLHGMIFGYITKTPTIVFENNNGKIGASYETWFEDIDFIELVNEASTVDSLVDLIDRFKKRDFKYNRIDYDFKNMAEIIGN